jgi:signal transduction histidine kinase
VGVLLSRWVSRPVLRLRDAATSLGSGDLQARAPTGSGPPEIRELALAFNATASQLQALLSSQEQFVADASHQLRSPLTAVRLRLEMIGDELADPEPDLDRVATDVAGARGEVARLNRLVDGLLALATAERVGSATSVAAPIALASLIEDRVEAWAPVAAERRITLSAGPRQLVAFAAFDKVSQVLDNLLANAIDASPSGGTIRIDAAVPPPGRDLDGLVELHVIDQGPGMSEAQRAHAFDRFWRADAVPGSLGGSGLGLAIVQKLVESDGGSVRLQVAPGGGVDAVVVLPSSTERLPVG